MRIIIYHRHLNYRFGGVVGKALERAGCQVAELTIKEGAEGAMAAVEGFKPDCILSIATAPELSHLFRERGVRLPVVHYELDKVMRAGFFRPGAFGDNDIVFSTYKDDVPRYLQSGARAACYLPFFPNARANPHDTSPDRFRYDVTFAGNLLYSNELFEYLDTYGKVAARNPQSKAVFESVISASIEMIITRQAMALDDNRYRVAELVAQVMTGPARDAFAACELDEETLTALCAKEAAHLQRQHFIEAIPGITIFGPDGNLAENPNVHYMGEVSLHEEISRVFESSRINLTLQRIYARDGLSDRVFNVLQAGGFLLSDRNDAITELFQEGEEVECFDSRDEMLDKIDYYLANERERERIAANGRARVIAEHTLEHRVDTLLATLRPLIR